MSEQATSDPTPTAQVPVEVVPPVSEAATNTAVERPAGVVVSRSAIYFLSLIHI